MNNKFERAIERLQPLLGMQQVTPVGKGERLRGKSTSFLQQLDPSVARVTRQRLQGEKIGEVVEIKSVMALLNDMELTWALLPFDQLLEWAALEGYSSLRNLKEKFEILFIGGGECTIEIVCNPRRSDIIDVFKASGTSGLREYLIETGERIATDRPGIAAYFFGAELLTVFGGSLEALPKSKYPVTVGIVETGNSLIEEDWLRLADEFPEARLLYSQLVVVIKRS